MLDQTQRLEVRDSLLAETRSMMADRLALRFGADERALAAEILSPLVVANSTFDAAATERARTEAGNLVPPVTVSLSRGEIIVRRGDRVDDIAREKLDQFGLLDPRPDTARAAGWFLLAGLTVLVLLAWLWRFRSQIWHRSSALLLVGARAARGNAGAEGDRRSFGPAVRRAHRRRRPSARRPSRRRCGA